MHRWRPGGARPGADRQTSNAPAPDAVAAASLHRPWRIEPIANGTRILDEKLRLAGEQLLQRGHGTAWPVAAAFAELIALPIEQAIEGEVPGKAQRLARQLRRHADRIGHLASLSGSARSLPFAVAGPLGARLTRRPSL